MLDGFVSSHPEIGLACKKPPSHQRDEIALQNRTRKLNLKF
jgi:hypothetical protein